MSEYQFFARKIGGEYPFAYDFGDNLEEMVAKFGADTVFYGARAAFVISAQAKLTTWKTGARHEATHHLSAAALNNKLNAEWVPTYTPRGVVDPAKVEESLDKTLGRLSPAEALAYMRARMAALEAAAEAAAEAEEVESLSAEAEAEEVETEEVETTGEVEVGPTLRRNGKRRRS